MEEYLEAVSTFTTRVRAPNGDKFIKSFHGAFSLSVLLGDVLFIINDDEISFFTNDVDVDRISDLSNSIFILSRIVSAAKERKVADGRNLC